MGDFSNCNGRGGESIYGGFFEDEDLSIEHDRRGLISMANIGRNTNGSQFFISFAPIPHLNGKHVVFGHLVQGLQVLDKIEIIETWKNCPIIILTVSNCGELIPRKKRISRFFSKVKFNFEKKLIIKNDEKCDKPKKKEDKKLSIKKAWFGSNGYLRRGRGFFRYKISRMPIKKVQKKQKKNDSSPLSEDKHVSQNLCIAQGFVLKKHYLKKEYFSSTKKQLLNKTNSIISRLSGKVKSRTPVKMSTNTNI